MNKIKVDFLALFQEGTGQTVYLKELSKEMEKLVDLKAVLPNEIPLFNFINRFSNSIALSVLPFLIQKEIRKYSIVHIINQELYHLIPIIENKKVVSLHDLGLYSYYNKWKKKDIEQLDKTEKIVCDSNNTKNDLIQNFPLLKGKAITVYNGLKSNLKKSNQNLRKKYSLNKTDRIILFVGSDESKKNFFTLLKAFSELKEENLVLVKIGSKWAFNKKNQRKKFEEFIKEKNLQEKVKFFDFLPEQDLIDFYFESEVFVCPSFFEGFGLTLIEAMACGCPVISSNKTSLPEIAGNSALFFNPENQTELKEKLSEILKDKKLQKGLIRKGFQNIKRFNWNKSAKKLVQIYSEIK